MKRIVAGLLFICLFVGVSCCAESIIIGNESSAVNESIDVDGELLMKIEGTQVVSEWDSFGQDSRNQYLVVPCYIQNLGFEDTDIATRVSIKLTYKDYVFDSVEMKPSDLAASTIEGTYTCYEVHIDNQEEFVFPVTITDLHEDGSCTVQWGKETDNKVVPGKWHENGHYLGIYENEGKILYYANGILAGGDNNNWRNILFRDGAMTSAEGTTLGMLEECVFNYVFKLPNAVINSLSECYLEIKVGEKEYTVNM